MTDKRLNRVVNSALWAAYGDAFGFITELADENILKSRLEGDTYVTELRTWTRRIGGLHGAYVNLPKGTYSDDTQLRLATSRAISSDGTFDVEAFAKVELPVWQSYSLGAGRGSKLAAANLSKSNVSYFSNFYSEKNASYVQSGGNGASMRIQPHVWSRPENSDTQRVVFDVFLNTICTHGNMVAIVGAIFHALCLKSSLEIGAVPNKEMSLRLLDEIKDLERLIKLDSQISSFWLPSWEESLQSKFSSELKSSIKMLELYIGTAFDFLENFEDSSIENLLYEVDAHNPSHRGSAILTSALAVAISHFSGNARQVEINIEKITNCLGVDTDTICTKVGALSGSVIDHRPKASVMDSKYIEEEATRLYEISEGVCSREFTYPDLFEWDPPKYQNSALTECSAGVFLEGLGQVKLSDGELCKGRNEKNLWQWVTTKFGQTMLVKRRVDLLVSQKASSKAGYRSGVKRVHVDNRESVRPYTNPKAKRSDVVDSNEYRQPKMNLETSTQSLDELTNEAIRSGFSTDVIGRHVLELSERANGIEQCIAYVAIISKARVSRSRRGS